MNMNNMINKHAIKTTGKLMTAEYWELFKACAIKAKPKAKTTKRPTKHFFPVIDDEPITQADLDYLNEVKASMQD